MIKYQPDIHTDVEGIKFNSDNLRGTLKQSLENPVTGSIADDDQILIKFHGVYQQDDRDLRNQRRKQKLEPLYSFMIRARVPGGVASAVQYLQMAELAEQYAGSSLRLTTRQAFQWHGVLKRNLKTTIAGINQSLLDTLAACGDVNRNVMSTALPERSAVHQEVYGWAQKLSDHLLPKTNAYHEIWLDGKKLPVFQNADEQPENAAEQTKNQVEPIYGDIYLPRKFKTAIAIPPHNDVDIYANDLGFVAIIEADKLKGFNVLVGGGMGSSHGDTSTYPRVASELGFVRPEQVLSVAEAVIKVQRDFGNREVRKHARLKYTIDRLGLDEFRTKVEEYAGYRLEPVRDFSFEHNGDQLGWIQTDDGNWHLTLYLHSGRIRDDERSQSFTGLKAIAKVHQGEFRISPNQNLIIANVAPENKAAITELVTRYGLSDGASESPTRIRSLACVAFPTCSLAMAEAERYLPSLLDKVDELIAKHQQSEVPINIRMTGCPNGCARPFLGEIGFVGKGPGKYNLYLGGNQTGSRLNSLHKENIDEAEILATLEPLLARFSTERETGEFFGDFLIRAGVSRAVNNGLDFHHAAS